LRQFILKAPSANAARASGKTNCKLIATLSAYTRFDAFFSTLLFRGVSLRRKSRFCHFRSRTKGAVYSGEPQKPLSIYVLGRIINLAAIVADNNMRTEEKRKMNRYALINSLDV
jgi:hypothetical protein